MINQLHTSARFISSRLNENQITKTEKRRGNVASSFFKLQIKTTSFGQLVIWFLVTLDEMKRAYNLSIYYWGFSLKQADWLKDLEFIFNKVFF